MSLSLFAQPGQTTLNIKLYPIQSIEFNDESDDTIIDSNYIITLNVNDNDNLKSYSTSSFVVKTSVNQEAEGDNDDIETELALNHQLNIDKAVSFNDSAFVPNDKVSQEVPDIIYSIETL